MILSFIVALTLIAGTTVIVLRGIKAAHASVYFRLKTVRAVFVAAALSSISVSCRRFEQNQSKQLVNASGLSTAEVLTLLNKGANINGRSNRMFGWTPLISAIYQNEGDIVDLLLAHGADVNLGDSENRTPLYWAIVR